MYGVPGTLDNQVIDELLVRASEGTQFGRQGEGDHKIVDGNLFLQLPFHPSLGFVMLAMRAVAVSAGVRQVDLLLAVRRIPPALLDLRGTAAVFDRKERVLLAGSEFARVLSQKLGSEGLDDAGESRII